jgi:hypothetical protein
MTPRILFYAERTLHLPFLEPIEAYLRTNGLARTAFSAPKFFAGTATTPSWGLPDTDIDRLQKLAPFFAEPADFEPEVTVVADACHYRIPHIRDVINVGHGMICKGAFYTDSPIIRRENLSRLLLVPGPWHAKRLKPNVFIPVQVTGFIKSDLLFGPGRQDREQFCRSLGIPSSKKIVLFAPTYNPELSAIPCVAEGIRKVAGADTVLLIKLHNLTDAKWKDMYRTIAASLPNVHYLEDADYAGMMHAADLMISDVSSIAIEFLLLDKPLVLFNNPRMHEFPLYRSGDIEYLTRNAGLQVDSLDGLLAAVKSELADPGRHSEIRQRYAQALDHGRDGGSARRAALAVLNWVKERTTQPLQDLEVFLLQPEEATAAEIQADVDDLRATSPEHRLLITVFGGREEVNDPDLTHVRTVLMNQTEICARLRQACGKRAVVLCGGLRLLPDWPKWLGNHFGWNTDAGAVKALTDPDLAVRCLRQLCPSPQPVTDPKTLAFGLLVSAPGQSLAAERLPSDCIMIETGLLRDLPGALPAYTPEEFVTALGLLASMNGRRTLMAMDCCMLPTDPKRRTLRQIQTLRRLGRHQEAADLAAQPLSPDPGNPQP